jgi:hypothetical protein
MRDHPNSRTNIQDEGEGDDSHLFSRSGNREDVVMMPASPWSDMYSDVSAVTRAVLFWRPLQLLLSYQISFGSSSGLMNYCVGQLLM